MARAALLILLLSSLAGCSELPASADKPEPASPTSLATKYDPSTCGIVTGRVTWGADVPRSDVFTYASPKGDGGFNLHIFSNPHELKGAEKNRGLANAVVFLRGIAPESSKPWDLPSASVELSNRSVDIRQGDGLHRVGFAKRGSPLTMQSKEAVFHNLRARGAAFFSLAFPVPEAPLTRTLDRAGLVHLTSGAGYYWASAFLFVDDLPYYTRTDAEGRFTLTGVPAGPVEVVAWHPNPSFSNQERDPESSAVTRQTYGEPFTTTVKTSVSRGATATVEMTLPGR